MSNKIEQLKKYLSEILPSDQKYVIIASDTESVKKLFSIGYKTRTRFEVLERVPIWVKDYTRFISEAFKDNLEARLPLYRRIEQIELGPPSIREMCSLQPLLMQGLITGATTYNIDKYDESVRLQQWLDKGIIEDENLESLFLYNSKNHISNSDAISTELSEYFYNPQLNGYYETSPVSWVMGIKENSRGTLAFRKMEDKPLLFSDYYAQVINERGDIVLNVGFGGDQIVGYFHRMGVETSSAKRIAFNIGNIFGLEFSPKKETSYFKSGTGFPSLGGKYFVMPYDPNNWRFGIRNTRCARG
jgi:hypothetical protein